MQGFAVSGAGLSLEGRVLDFGSCVEESWVENFEVRPVHIRGPTLLKIQAVRVRQGHPAEDAWGQFGDLLTLHRDSSAGARTT